MKEYKYFPHGFLNFDMPLFGIKEAAKTVKTSIEWFKEAMED